MDRRIRARAISLLLFAALTAIPALAARTSFASGPETELVAPVLKAGAKKWRIGLVQGGDYPYYDKVLVSLVKAFADLGWIQPWPEGHGVCGLSAAGIWARLATSSQSRYLEFVQDAFWSAGWDKEKRPHLREQIKERLQKGDLDAVIALGTWSGQDLAGLQDKVPVFVFQTSDPVAAGIVPSAVDSGRDNLYVHCDPDRFKRQMRIFHHVARFSQLGVAYEDSKTGRSYAGLADIEAVAAERGFSVVHCHAENLAQGEQISSDSYRRCYEELARTSDAVVFSHGAVLERNFDAMLAPVLERKMPSFAQGGSIMVRRGALMSMAQTEFRMLGAFYARIMAQVFHGATPRSLPQTYEDPPVIAVNLKTAKLIGFTLPMDVLGAAGEIFSEIDPAGGARQPAKCAESR